MPVAPGTGCACHGRRSRVPCSSPEPSGEYGRRSCPTSAGGCGSRSVTTTRERTRWRARASCSRPRPTVGYQGSVERTGLRPAPWSAFRPLSAGHGRRACCAGRHSSAFFRRGGSDSTPCAPGSSKPTRRAPPRSPRPRPRRGMPWRPMPPSKRPSVATAQSWPNARAGGGRAREPRSGLSVFSSRPARRPRAVGSVTVRTRLDRAGGTRWPLTAVRPQRAGCVTRRAGA